MENDNAILKTYNCWIIHKYFYHFIAFLGRKSRFGIVGPINYNIWLKTSVSFPSVCQTISIKRLSNKKVLISRVFQEFFFLICDFKRKRICYKRRRVVHIPERNIQNVFLYDIFILTWTTHNNQRNQCNMTQKVLGL